jgi:hypothetical protein
MIWGRWIFGIAFAIETNAYFGWHLKPQSDAELVTDGIVLLIFALSWRP